MMYPHLVFSPLRPAGVVVAAFFAVVVSGYSAAASGDIEVAAEAVQFADPAADLPVAVIEEVSAADMAPIRSVNVVPAASVGAGPESDTPATVREDNLPLPIAQTHFRELMENSPFTRSLNLSDSLILTGVARFDGKPMATLMNKETKETYVISDVPNPQGWKMVEISPGDDLETVTAKISVAGGELVTVRFDETRLKPGEAKPAAASGGGGMRKGPRGPGGGGGESDDERRKRFSEIREKMSSMSEDQRAKLRETMERKMRENPGMNPDQRSEVFRKALDEVGGRGGRR